MNSSENRDIGHWGREEGRVYLDHNATTPVADFLREKVTGWMELWGNPSSIHYAGRGPKALLRLARQDFAKAIGALPLELVFTSGGSESNNTAIKGVYEHLCLSGKSSERNHYILSAVEHPSVKIAMEYLQRQGARVDILAVNRNGEVDLEELEALLSEETALVSVMFANNETGNILPVKKIVKKAHKVGALVHCDAVQALGKVPINMGHLGVDLCSFSAHKVYSLKGCGVLYIKRGTMIESLIHGGGQERGRRAGTENLLAIACFGSICQKLPELLDDSKNIERLRNKMESRILSEISGCQITGVDGKRLPNSSSIVIQGIDGESLLMNLDLKGYSVSTGAACSSGSPEPSPSLLAMGLSHKEAQSSLRLSLGVGNSDEDIHNFVDTLKSVVERLRSFSETRVSG